MRLPRGAGGQARAARAVLLLLLLALGSGSCTGGGAPGEPIFADSSASSGIDFKLVNGASGDHFIIETMLGGVAWIDYDGDGDYDLFLVNGHSRPREARLPGEEEDRLYRNDGRGHFTDVTRQAGVGDRRYGSGAAVGDYDNDGDSDLLVTNFGRNTLYRNNGDGTFTDITEAAGLREEGYSTSAAWFDMDRDGKLDLYVARYVKYDPATARRCREKGLPIYCSPKLFSGEADLLYRNRGDGTFEEVGRKAGIAHAGESEGKGLGVATADFDRDGWIDVYVANDTTPNFLFRNNGDGTFSEIGQAAGVALSGDGRTLAGMGVDLADVNGDGYTDIYVTNYARELNSLYLGGEGCRFEEAGLRSGLGATFLPLGFGAVFLDADLDGAPDLVTVNGHVDDQVDTTHPEEGSGYRQRPSLYLNRGGGVFEEGSARGGEVFRSLVVGRGLASADFDGDGDVDLAVMTLDRSLLLLENRNPLRNRSLTVRLIGTRSPRDPYGARVEAVVGGKSRAFIYQSARSYLSASDPRIVIGLGKRSRVERLRIDWPSGRVQELREVPTDGFLTVREPE